MKKLIALFLVMSMMPFQALASCDWKTGIHLLPDSNYEYSHDCHIRVGETVRDLGVAQQQVILLNQAIDLKDLTISKADERADMWMKTSQELEKRVETLDKMNTTTKWLYFGLGVLATSAALYGASKLVNH